MKILLITPSYPPVLGGLQTVTHSLAVGLLTKGHDVRVVTNRYPRSLRAFEVINDVTVRRMLFLKPSLQMLRSGRMDLLLASMVYYPCTLFSLMRLVSKFRPAVVHLHFPDSQISFVRMLRRFFKFKLVVSFHGHDIQRYFNEGVSYEASELKSLLTEADAVSACSEALLSRVWQLDASVKSKSYVIGNGIDPGRFQLKEVFRHTRPYVFAAGRLNKVKGFDLLMEAFSRVAGSFQNIDLMIAGEGEERQALERLAETLNMKNRIYLTGRVSPSELVKLLNGCEFAAVPSRQEEFGLSALEAMAAGKAVLATRVGGLPEIVDEKRNRLVEPTVEGIEGGLRALLYSLSLTKEAGEENRKEALKHTLDGVVEKYLEVYQYGKRQVIE